jgi:hypothetical protein
MLLPHLCFRFDWHVVHQVAKDRRRQRSTTPAPFSFDAEDRKQREEQLRLERKQRADASYAEGKRTADVVEVHMSLLSLCVCRYFDDACSVVQQEQLVSSIV